MWKYISFITLMIVFSYTCHGTQAPVVPLHDQHVPTDSTGWSKPQPIFQEVNRQEAQPQAAIKDNRIFLIFRYIEQNQSSGSFRRENPESNIYYTTYTQGQWAPAEHISQNSYYSGQPRIAVIDGSENRELVIIWGERRGDLRTSKHIFSINTLFTSSYDGQQWSTPSKILQLPNKTHYFSNVINDNKENLHLVFKATDCISNLRYTYHIQEKQQDTWTTPYPILLDGSPADSFIGLDDGRIFLAYTDSDLEGALRTGYDRNSLFLEEFANVRGEKQLIHQGGENSPAFKPYLYQGRDRKLHLFWFQGKSKSQVVAHSIRHVVSEDAKKWSTPKTLMETKSETKGNPQPGSLVVSEDANGTMYAIYGVGKGAFSPLNKLFFSVWDGNEWITPREPFDFNDFSSEVNHFSGGMDLVYREKDKTLHLLFSAGTKNISKLYHSVYKTSPTDN